MFGLIFVYFLLLQRYSARWTQIPLAWVQSWFFHQNVPIPLDIWHYDIDRCVWYGKMQELFQQGWRMFAVHSCNFDQVTIGSCRSALCFFNLCINPFKWMWVCPNFEWYCGLNKYNTNKSKIDCLVITSSFSKGFMGIKQKFQAHTVCLSVMCAILNINNKCVFIKYFQIVI